MLSNFSRHKIILILNCSILILISSCKKFVEADLPNTKITSAAVYENNISAMSAMTAVYSNLLTDNNNSVSGIYSLSYLCGLSADELKYYSNDYPLFSHFYSNSLLTTDNITFWGNFLNKIYLCNSILEGLNASTKISPQIKTELIGEAEFMRAFLHFYLLNLYGDIPLVTSTDYRINSVAERTSKDLVYAQIVADLKDAQQKLPESFVDPAGNPTSERTRPNKGAATALLARVYLYTGDWANAAIQASSVISDNTNYNLNTDLDSVFLANSTEAIWQLQPVEPGYNTYDAVFFVLLGTPGTGRFLVTLSDQLLSSFEAGDYRRDHWVGTFDDPETAQTYYFPYKYKIYTVDASQPVTEYIMVFRLAEQYLIRAEAEAQQGDVDAAKADLDAIRARAGLPETTASNQQDMINAILHEKQVELFTEFGHRWLDLKRSGQADAVMSIVTPLKGGSWNSNWALYPISLEERQKNHNLTQNSGY